jgi:hypothetical protein
LGQLVAAAAAAIFAFWPQGGVLGRDLTFANSVDLDPAAGATLDPWCGHRTYDGHTGEDIAIRSFREVDIGVPVFSLTDGKIFEVQDGMYDYRFGPTVSTFDNHLIVAAADGRYFVYGHLRHGLAWKKGQTVQAGEQIGWSASSGNSAWPHLHLTELGTDGAPRELFSGPCNRAPGDTFANEHPFADSPYARNVVVSARPFTGKAQLPWDLAKRTGTFVAGTRDVYLRLELGAYAGGTPTIQLGDLRDTSPTLVPEANGQSTFDVHERVRFDHSGAVALRVTLGGVTLVDRALRVVARPSQVRDRPPDRVALRLTTAAGVAQCTIVSPFAVRDPDFDVVRYRYVWRAGSKVLRTVTSAMLSDLVRVPAGSSPTCSVTPSDGKLSGPTASVH